MAWGGMPWCRNEYNTVSNLVWYVDVFDQYFKRGTWAKGFPWAIKTYPQVPSCCCVRCCVRCDMLHHFQLLQPIMEDNYIWNYRCITPPRLCNFCFSLGINFDINPISSTPEDHRGKGWNKKRKGWNQKRKGCNQKGICWGIITLCLEWLEMVDHRSCFLVFVFSNVCFSHVLFIRKKR